MEKEICLSRVEPELAAQILAGLHTLDPRGLCQPQDIQAMAKAGQCFAATAPGAQAVYIVKVSNGIAWIDACKGFGPVDWSLTLLPVIEAQAKGCAAVGFQTKRRGLVKQAKKQGYTVAGYIMRKSLQ